MAKATELFWFSLTHKQHLTWLTITSLKHSLFGFCGFTLSWFSALPSNADVLLDSIFDSCPILIHRFNYPLMLTIHKSLPHLPWASDPYSQLLPMHFHLDVPLAPSHYLLPKPVPPLIVPTLTCPSGKQSHPRTVPLKAILHSTTTQPQKTKSYSLVKNLKIFSGFSISCWWSWLTSCYTCTSWPNTHQYHCSPCLKAFPCLSKFVSLILFTLWLSTPPEGMLVSLYAPTFLGCHSHWTWHTILH